MLKWVTFVQKYLAVKMPRYVWLLLLSGLHTSSKSLWMRGFWVCSFPTHTETETETESPACILGQWLWTNSLETFVLFFLLFCFLTLGFLQFCWSWVQILLQLLRHALDTIIWWVVNTTDSIWCLSYAQSFLWTSYVVVLWHFLLGKDLVNDFFSRLSSLDAVCAWFSGRGLGLGFMHALV